MAETRREKDDSLFPTYRRSWGTSVNPNMQYTEKINLSKLPASARNIMKNPSVYLKTLSLILSLEVVLSSSVMAFPTLKLNSASDHQQPSETLLARNKGLNFGNRRIRASLRRVPGFSRGSGICYGQEVEVIPLVPEAADKNQVPVETTVLANPTFLVHIGKTSATKAIFALLSPDGGPIYEKTITLDKTPGVVTVSLPESTTEEEELLKASTQYQWIFILRCDDTGDFSGDLVFEGWIERIAPETSLAQKLATASEAEKPGIFAEYGLWLDTVGSLAKLRQDNPNDPEVQANWQAALDFAGLEKLVEEPLLSDSGSTLEN